MNLYYIKDKLTNRYYNFVEDCFIGGISLETFTESQKFAEECFSSLKRCGWVIELKLKKIVL